VFGSGQLNTEGRISSEAGIGIAAGNISVVTGQGGVTVQAGNPGSAELAFIAAIVLPFANVGPIFDTRVSLTTLGARAQIGVVRGRGVIGFIGPVFQGPDADLGTAINFGDQLLERMIQGGSGNPGNPGPPPPSAIPPF